MDTTALLQYLATAQQPLTMRVRLMVGKGTLHLVDDAPQVQTVQATFLADETRDGVERPQNYGFTSVPLPGMQPIAVFVGGDRSQGIVIAMADRQYRLKGLRRGEVAIYDDQGQSVHLTREGIVVKGAGLPVTITDTPKVRAETPMLECTGEIKDRCDSPDGRAMSDMRDTYDDHRHRENDDGGPTDPPTEAM